jgi:hypothetical protein
MSDEGDEPEAKRQVRRWFRQAGEHRVAAESQPYNDQQADAGNQVPRILAVGSLLALIWMMDAHHRNELAGGASLNKAVALFSEYPLFAPMADRALRTYWSSIQKGGAFLRSLREPLRYCENPVPPRNG